MGTPKSSPSLMLRSPLRSTCLRSMCHDDWSVDIKTIGIYDLVDWLMSISLKTFKNSSDTKT